MDSTILKSEMRPRTSDGKKFGKSWRMCKRLANAGDVLSWWESGARAASLVGQPRVLGVTVSLDDQGH